MDVSPGLLPVKKKASLKSEDVFKIASCLTVIMWSVCIKNFLKFREYLEANNMFCFSLSYGWYILGSFCFIFVTRYGYNALCKDFLDNRVLSDKFDGEVRKRKLQSLMKLSYDTVFYSTTSIGALFMFRGEPWFPVWLGGSGSCKNIYSSYPNIPPQNEHSILVFYSIQLGVHIFSVFEVIVIKRKTDLKYYENLLHHLLAASLIAFSAMSNDFLAGSLILIAHDFSDVFLAFSRSYIDTKFSQKWYFVLPIACNMIFWWIYMRLLVFPFCLIAQTISNAPQSTDPWAMLYYSRKLLDLMALILFGMHIYWTYYIIKSGLTSIRKKGATNLHDVAAKKIQQ